MKILTYALIVAFSLLTSVFCRGGEEKKAGGAAPSPAAAAAQTDDFQIVATYFYTSQRCYTCKKIEEFAQKSIEDNFRDELTNKKIIWRAINVDEPLNKHYIQDFQLYSKSVIIEKRQGEKTIAWKNLEKVWELVYNEQKFRAYMVDELRQYLTN